MQTTRDQLAAISPPSVAGPRKRAVKGALLTAVGVSSLWLFFWVGFVIWWMLMSALFRSGAYAEAVIIAYALPTVYTVMAFVGTRRPGQIVKLLHLLSFGVSALLFAGLLASLGEAPPLGDPSPYLGIALIAFVVALMQYPFGGLDEYSAYRSSMFLGGVIFMPLFIYFAALLPNVPQPPAPAKVYLFPIGMAGFWLSGAWLALKGTQGRHVSGHELRPLMPFRPDFILPGGVNFVKGTVLMGVGLMIAIHPQLGMPKWNWWGFIFAFWGILTLIPLRGMFKMVKGRRLRMLGLGGTGLRTELIKGSMLFVGLLILLYGFVNAFFGSVPFTALGVTAEFSAFSRGSPAGQALSAASFLAALAVLVPLRGWYKTRLLEGIETWPQMFWKQALLWVGTLLLFVATIHFTNLPPIRGRGVMGLYPETNPVGFAVGLALFLAGSALMLILRPIALRREMAATMTAMVGAASDQGHAVQRWILERRLRTLAAMPDAQRDQHFRWMADGLARLEPEDQRGMISTQMSALVSLDAEARAMCMRSMDRALGVAA
ncbi:MAG: hypothetical protein ACE5M4_12995 [Anaerolineales bacterium]